MLPPIHPSYQPTPVIVPLSRPVGQVTRINPDSEPSSRHDQRQDKNQPGGNAAMPFVEEDDHPTPQQKPHHNQQIDVWAGSVTHNAASARIFL